MSKEDSLIGSYGKAERIGVLGSPSSTANLTVDILGTAVDKRLVGNLCVFDFDQEGKKNYAISQITEITMKNVWTEDPTIRGLIRHKGQVDPITARQDIHTAKMMVSSIFSSNNGNVEPSILGNIPSTGTSVKLLNEEIMQSLFEAYQDEIFYLGKSYGTNIKMPMWFRHFGKGIGGANEAYHLGVFGKTGSGKSVLSTMVLLAYARHKEMSIFVLDPQGEFTKNLKENQEINNLLMNKLGKKIEFYNLHNLILSGMDLFKRVLIQSNFLNNLGIFYETNKQQTADLFENVIKTARGDEIKPWHLYKREVFDQIWNSLQDDHTLTMIYSTPDLRNRVSRNVQNANKDQKYNSWRKIANLFKYSTETKEPTIAELVEKIKEEKNIIIIDLSEHNIPEDVEWTDDVKFTVIEEFINKITQLSEKEFKKNNLLNSLVVIDEAHRLAPRERPENENLEQIKTKLIDGVRTTRKYGLGWMFISQTLSSLDKRIIDQIRIYMFGFGLAWGVERNALRELIGGQDEAFALYQMFKDPQSSLGEREYPFMSIGPISPLSFSGTPLFITASKYPEEYLRNNFR